MNTGPYGIAVLDNFSVGRHAISKGKKTAMDTFSIVGGFNSKIAKANACRDGVVTVVIIRYGEDQTGREESAEHVSAENAKL